MRAQLARAARLVDAAVAGALLLCLAGPAAAQAPKTGTAAKSPVAPLAIVRDVTRTTLPQGERVTITFSDEVAFKGDRVENPDRVYFDFAHSTLPASLSASSRAIGAGTLVASVRIARHTEESTRLVLELTGSPRYSVFTLYGPYR